MEVVLTRLRAFSCRDATFDDRSSAGQTESGGLWSGVTPRAVAGSLPGGCAGRICSPYRVDIQSALAWLRRELMEMRSQDQTLIRQLMELHAGIQELKQELSEEKEEEEEATCWDFDSSSSVCSSSGEEGTSISCLTAGLTLPTLPASRVRTLLCRRSSLP